MASQAQGSRSQDGSKQTVAAGAEPAEALASPAGPGGPDVPPSYTTSGSYGGGKVTILQSGIDSLYLSFQGELGEDVEAKLASLKLLAQSKQRREEAKAQYPIKGHLFEVRPGGQRMHPYILEDGAFRIAIASGESRKIPFAYVKVSSDVLAHRDVQSILSDLTDVLGELAAKFEIYPTVSRVDVFADFQTGLDLEAIRQDAWITRAASAVSYFHQGKLSGWSIGAGSSMSARLYDKTLEIKLKSHKAYLVERWKRNGFDPALPVWRLEFQLTREVLDQLGITGVNGLLRNIGGIWAYGTQSWLQLAVPREGDQNRGRWAVHPLWERLQEIRWRLDDEPLTRTYRPTRVPTDERLFRLFIALLTSYIAAHAMWEYRKGLDDFMEKCEAFYRSVCPGTLGVTLEEWIELQARAKGRLFNSLRNVPDPEEEAKSTVEEDADAIRIAKATRGE
jgi:hypothetical protein